MHLTRLGFNLLVAAYLAPLVLIDFIGNTTSTEAMSDFYYAKAILDGVLMAYAIYQAFFTEHSTASVGLAQARKSDSRDDVVDFAQIGAVEYVYCLVLSAYAAVNWYFLHDINKHSTGFVSVATLIWSFLSFVVCALAFIQFYNLKSGKIVELRKRILQ